jgi:hypothetical protein
MTDDECGAYGEMIGKWNWITENLPHCHFIHHKSHMGLSRAQIPAATVGSQQLTGWAMTQLYSK